ncbi:hypothetical protein SeLEV6574_g04468 [Synchytrium endobioticum]|nr:hypothetical protein SeLEV6574_g04468 [Synchytrium endobioticum]
MPPLILIPDLRNILVLATRTHLVVLQLIPLLIRVPFQCFLAPLCIHHTRPRTLHQVLLVARMSSTRLLIGIFVVTFVNSDVVFAA